MKSKKVFLTFLAVLCILVVGLTGCGTKTEIPVSTVTLPSLDTRVGSLEAWKIQVDATFVKTATMDWVNSTIASKVAPDLSNYATNAELAAYATDADLNAFIDNLTADQIAALKTKLGLSASSDGGDVSSGLVTCELKSWSDLVIPAGNYNPLSLPPGIPQSLSYDFKATIFNTSSQDLEDVSFTFAVVDLPYSVSLNLTECVEADGTLCGAEDIFCTCVGNITHIPATRIDGDYFAWVLWGSNPRAPVFRSQSWGFNLDAGEEMDVYITLNLGLSVDVAYSVMFDVEMECEGYDIAN